MNEFITMSFIDIKCKGRGNCSHRNALLSRTFKIKDSHRNTRMYSIKYGKNKRKYNKNK